MKSSNRVLRIAITGPESTGKSTLCRQLANYYHTNWVPEFARTYIDKLNRNYHEQDLIEIAKGQIDLEKIHSKNAQRLIFCDTELLVIKIWSMHKYGRVHPTILTMCNEISYDLYLLTKPDLYWQHDSQRENPSKGDYFFQLFKDELLSRNATFKIVEGKNDKRLMNAVGIINNIFSI